ncbi:unnamed protein product [Parascedosporium putredinis]|uniref:Orotidine 5'-phosphate decarboxylase n=1 Tax=Parascedosporium putredinis TaxID=1442378 RepID=A0A9P1GWF9_9PEZI|nr:unnamed protein product [Parascedosporium putredinis]CAI7988759.1 unnamed protein product [Parascedosporium putredinis]
MTQHPVLKTPYAARAEAASHPLTAYLLRLMELKKSNLCLSADVNTARELLTLADKVGPSIVVLKTHYDVVGGWDFNPQTGTGAKLASLARKHGLGGGSRRGSLKWRGRYGYEVKTSVTIGTPRSESFDEEEEEALRAGRLPRLSKNIAEGDESEACKGIEEAPIERGLLILAQMSTVDTLISPEYTKACVEAAREHKDFVMGFISQENLNREAEDQFICMTPGCQLPPEGQEGNGVAGDGKGQQYNTPDKLIVGSGVDIVIVGRGILKADDPPAEAERYRRTAWQAYESRVG